MNFGDIVGEMMRQGMSPQTQKRIEHATGPDGLGGTSGSADLGAILGSVLGGGSSGSGSAGGLGDVLGSLLGGKGAASSGQGGGGLADVLGSVLGGGQSSGGQTAGAQSSGSQSPGGLGDILGNLGGMLGSPSGVGGMSKGELGGLGALAGAILGGGGSSAKGAVGGSAMAILGTLALSALKNWQAQSASAGDSVNALGLTETEVKQISAPETAELCLRGMIEAIKSDGQVSQDEIEKLTGKLSEGGITEDEKQFVQAEMAKTPDLAGLVKAIPNPEVGIQVYAAALMAITVDTPAERAFLKGLADGTGIGPDAVARLHQMVGAPVA